ncbi:non-homologous end-joining factor 1-like [Halichondria panicea]|uniref:non-homologous end-joining factor 1-like n=1 Tax=Halichondria panicea TaxID=6063 RepID=UPI00312BB1AA
MSWLQEPVSLESNLWRVLKLNGRDFILKGHVEGSSYHVMLSDLCTIWEETLASDDILQRSKELNRNIEAPLLVILKRIGDNVSSNEPGSSFALPSSTPSHPHTLTLSLTTTLASLPFQWNFNLEQAAPKSMGAQLVAPLLRMVGELTHRGEELAQILTLKDKEIQDYKEQGARVSRKHFETAPFVEESFATEMTSSSAFPARALHSFSVISNPSVQCLYGDIAKARRWAERNDGVIEEVSDPPVSAAAVMSSLTSPVKKPPPESPSKEDEEARRRELERKLESEKQKPKKKKRKLM